MTFTGIKERNLPMSAGSDTHSAALTWCLAVELCAIFILACIAFSSPVYADESQNRAALIIGISEYESKEVPRLRGVEKDLRSAAQVAMGMGIPKEKIRYVTGPEATKPNIISALKALAQEQHDGRVFIYFSGHGTRAYDPSNKGCLEGLLTYEGSAITNSEFARAMQQVSNSSDKVIAIFDACFSEGVMKNGARKTRSVGEGALFTPKFSQVRATERAACENPVNYLTRSLVDESTRLGAIRENVVLISAAKENEASFDDPVGGGLATQGLRDCMLGKAEDLDRSGGVSLEEIRQCAQTFIDQKVGKSSEYLPHHITISGNRNLIPIASLAQVPNRPEVSTPVVSAMPTQPELSGDHQRVPTKIPSALPLQESKPPTQSVTAQSSSHDEAIKPLSSLATLKDIEAQRNPRRTVDVIVDRSVMRIG
jgi:hypothetical protein